MNTFSRFMGARWKSHTGTPRAISCCRIITCCASEEVRRKTGGKLIYVEGGKLRECTST